MVTWLPALTLLLGVTPETLGEPGEENVKWSLVLVEDVPAAVVTVMSMVPAASGGDVTTIDVSDTTAKSVGCTDPKVTAVAPVKLVPVSTAFVPPSVLPEFAVTDETVGAEEELYVNWSAAVTTEDPVLVTATISTVPDACGGATATTRVSDSTVKLAAGWLPKSTVFVPDSLAPLMVTTVPPALVPVEALKPLIVGLVDAVYENWSALEIGDSPAAFTTVTSTVPPRWAGATTVREVDELSVKDETNKPANRTSVTPTKLVPVMVIDVPPAVGPVAVLSPVTVGVPGNVLA
jgi:hypothetical protein